MESGIQIDAKTTFKKFIDAGGGKPLELEFDAKKNGQLLEACLDMLYVASEGNLWNGGSIFAAFGRSEIFPRGCQITFIPVPLDLSDQKNEKVAVFTYSKDLDHPTSIVSSLGVKCEITEKGHLNLSGRFSSKGYHSQNQMLGGAALLSLGLVQEKSEV